MTSLSSFRGHPAPIDEESGVSLADLRAAIVANGAIDLWAYGEATGRTREIKA